MLWVYDHSKYFTLLVRRSTLESDVLISKNMTSKVGPRAERVNTIFPVDDSR